MPSSASDTTYGLVGQSPQIVSVRRLIRKAARNSLPVLLLGESGTGKEVVAQAIYAARPRGQFVPIDCGSLVGTLIESELYGHTKGSFSGAIENKKGLADLADGGTAFFDEIGDLPLDLQVKLLRLIETREFRPVGALKWHPVDLRLIAATNRDLKTEVERGRFRRDLFYRLNVFPIHLPPLREHKQDIPLLVDHFLEQGRAEGLPDFQPSDQLLEVLCSHDWPGNVRELKNCIEYISVMQSEGALERADLPTALRYHMAAAGVDEPVPVIPEACPEFVQPQVISILDVQRKAITQALSATGGERGKAAHLLGIGRTTLYRKMKEYGMK